MDQYPACYQDEFVSPDFEIDDTVGICVRLASWTYLSWLVAVTAMLIVALVTNRSGFSQRVMWVGVGLYILVAIVHFLRILVFKGNWFAPDVVFVLSFGLFHFGYVLPYLLHLVPYSDRIFYASQVMNPTVLFSALCGTLFLAGYEMAALLRPRVIYTKSPLVAGDIALYAGRIIFLLGVGMQLIAISRHGLSNVMHSSWFAEGILAGRDVRFWSMGGDFLSLGLILYAVANIHIKGKVFTGYLFPIVVLIRIALAFLSGRRFDLVLSVLPFVLVYHYFKRPIKTRYLIIAFLAALFFSEVAGLARSFKEYSFGAFVKAVQEVQTPFLNTSVEAGASIGTVSQTMYLIQSGQPYWHGESYWTAFVRLIPNVLPSLRTGHRTPSVWMTEEMIRAGLSGGAGAGSSMAAEAYLNFGFFGAIVLLVIGAFHRLIYDAVLVKQTLVRMIVIVTAVTHLFIWPRQWCGAYVRHVAWAFLLALVIQFISGRRENRTLG
jgi:oligosaccharide repeat unit polymerase